LTKIDEAIDDMYRTIKTDGLQQPRF